MFGRSSNRTANAPAPEVQVEQSPAVSAVAQARDIVCEVLDRLAEEVRVRTIEDIVLVLEDLVEELEAYNANHPDDAYDPAHISGVLDAIVKVRLS
jgi:hypothetical protein